MRVAVALCLLSLNLFAQNNDFIGPPTPDEETRRMAKDFVEACARMEKEVGYRVYMLGLIAEDHVAWFSDQMIMDLEYSGVIYMGCLVKAREANESLTIYEEFGSDESRKKVLNATTFINEAVDEISPRLLSVEQSLPTSAHIARWREKAENWKSYPEPDYNPPK